MIPQSPLLLAFVTGLMTALVALITSGNAAASFFAGAVPFFITLATYERRRKKPAVIWLTGLPGSGKSTVAEGLARKFRLNRVPVEHIDGDGVRNIFPKTGFTPEARDEHIRRVGYLASRLEQNGIVVIVSLISPYTASRQFVRNLCKSFYEIHISTPACVCEERDPKGHYAKAREGILKDFTGINGTYEIPETPELRLDTSRIGVDEAVGQIQKIYEASR